MMLFGERTTQKVAQTHDVWRSLLMGFVRALCQRMILSGPPHLHPRSRGDEQGGGQVKGGRCGRYSVREGPGRHGHTLRVSCRTQRSHLPWMEAEPSLMDGEPHSRWLWDIYAGAVTPASTRKGTAPDILFPTRRRRPRYCPRVVGVHVRRAGMMSCYPTHPA